MSFDLLGILYRIYVAFVYRERFRIKRRKKKKEQKKKKEEKKKRNCKIMIYVEYIN